MIAAAVPARGFLAARPLLENAFDQAQALASRERHAFCVARIGSDRPTGKALRRVAAAVSRTFRTSDLLGPWGEGLAALLPHTTAEGGARALGKTLLALQASGVPATFSAGVAEAPPGAAWREVLDAAEGLLRRARREGGNRILSPASRAEAGLLPRKRILLVEDDRLIASVVGYRLELDGFEVFPYAGGMAACATAALLRPSLAIVDVQMPGLDGFRLVERLRDTPALSRMPIVMLGAFGTERDLTRSLELGANDYLVKPFSPVELLARVHRLLKEGG